MTSEWIVNCKCGRVLPYYGDRITCECGVIYKGQEEILDELGWPHEENT